jgi:hypothetical protein
MKQLFILLAITGFNLASLCQSLTPYVVASTGLSASYGSISLSWTLGERVIQTVSDANFILTQGFHQGTRGGQLSGYFRYNNAQQTPLDSMKIVLEKNGVKVDSVMSLYSGYYRFPSLVPGTYQVRAYTGKPWAGINGTDAVKVQRHFAGLEILTVPVRLSAADVNNSGAINGTDAVKIKRRFAGLDTYFDRGDWTFEKTTGGTGIVVGGSNITQDFDGLCVGDVNGSNIPSPGKFMPVHVEMESNGYIEVRPGEEFEFPIKAKNDMSVSAISLVIPYPDEYLEIIGILFSPANPVYNIKKDEIRFVWSEIQSLSLKAGERLLTLKLRAKEDFTGDMTIGLQPTPESELADNTGELIAVSELTECLIKPLRITGMEEADPLINACSVYPNPARDIVNVEIQLKSPAACQLQVADMTGRILQTGHEERFEKGTAKMLVNTANLPAGMYTLITRISNDSERSSFFRKIIINK